MLTIICFFFSGILLGILIGRIHFNTNFEHDYVEVYIEEHENEFFAYNYANDKFLHKQKTYEELINQLKLQFEDKSIHVMETVK